MTKAYTNLSNTLKNDFNLSSKAMQEVNKELETLSAAIEKQDFQGGYRITFDDLSSLIETIFHYTTNKEAARDELYPEYKQIRNYLDGVKIKYSAADKAEFSDDWNRIKCIIGLKTISSKEGQEVTTALKEINEICGRIFDDECCTQEGFLQLVCYLQNIPSKIDCFTKSLEVNGYDLPGMVARAAMEHASEVKKISWNTSSAEKKISKISYRVEENKQYNSKEIYFEKMPAKETREALKKMRFRWHSLKKCWYGFATMEAIKAAC